MVRKFQAVAAGVARFLPDPAGDEETIPHEHRRRKRVRCRSALATADPLGIGGLLVDAARAAQLTAAEAFEGGQLMTGLLSAAARGVAEYARHRELRRPADQRLAFRELGLCIGLASVDLIEKEIAAGGLVFPDCAKFSEGLEAIGPYLELGPVVQSFWLDPRHRAGRTWHDHQDINDVMLAASLLPEGGLLRLGASRAA